MPCQLSVINLYRSRQDFVLVFLGGRCQRVAPSLLSLPFSAFQEAWQEECLLVKMAAKGQSPYSWEGTFAGRGGFPTCS